ncbi:MAG TPA: ABC transporter substrate-binding protein [Vicinamibacterales bacterium]|nr:ABC transporter substrate-binding protein [Vicinamibacterales bacterium]
MALLAIGSAALAVAQTDAARPRYGGTVRIQDAGTIATPDPAAEPADGAQRAARARLLPLVFETLVAIDPAGGLRPRLAVAWECDSRCAQWRFRLRRDVSLHDGSVLEPWHVAAALRRANAAWVVETAGDAVVIDTPDARPDLPWELAELRYGVAVRSNTGEWIGSGPFRLHRFEPRHLSLRAHENYWNSRPFIDAVEVDLGQAPGDQVTSLELGRADIVSVRPTDLRRLSQRGLRTASTRPLDLVAVTFEQHRAEAADDVIRRAVAAAIDRPVLSTALLHGHAEPATGLLPPWLSGYQLPRARRAAAPAAIASLPLARRRVTLRIDGGDPLAQAVAERIVVDAREAGVAITVQAPAGLAPRADARLVRVTVPATSPDRALAGVMAALGPRVVTLATPEGALPPLAPIESVYRLERALLERDVIVPVVHLSEVYGIADGVESRSGALVQPWGAWDLGNVWLARQQAGPR